MGNLKINAYLKSVKRESKPIIFNISFGYKEVNALTGKAKYIPLYYSSGISVKENEWSSEVNLPKDRKLVGEMLELERVIRTTYEYLVTQNVKITPKLLGRELDRTLGREVSTDDQIIPICQYIEFKMEKSPNRSSATQTQFKTLRGKLENYEATFGVQLTNESLNREHYLNFMEQVKSEMNRQNAVWKIQKNLNAVLNELRREYPNIFVFSPTDQLSSSEKTSMVEEKKVYLEFDKIAELIEHRPSNEKLANVKLILLTLVFTGCRYSDVFKVLPEHTYKDNNLEYRYAHFITDKKPKTEVIVPILKPLEEALAMNDGNPPKKISSQRFNQYVKELGQEIGWTDDVKIVYTDAHGDKQFEVKPFYKFISSHIGRRTFISNLIDVIPVTLLSKVTGHNFKDKEVIFQYNKTNLLKSSVRFVQALKRLSKGDEFKEEFFIDLV